MPLLRYRPATPLAAIDGRAIFFLDRALSVRQYRLTANQNPIGGEGGVRQCRHDFGMYPKETTSTGWFEAFVRWIGMHGMLKPGVSGTGGAAN